MSLVSDTGTLLIYIMMAASVLLTCDSTMQLREYIDDTEDYINIQVKNEQQEFIAIYYCVGH